MSDNNDNKKRKILEKVLVIILFICGTIFVSLSFYCNYSIDTNVIIMFLILIILALSESFNNFSIGTIFSLNREIDNKNKEKNELKLENIDLKDKLFNITNNILNHQTNIAFNGLVTPEIIKMITTEKASKDEIEKKKNEEEIELKNETKNKSTTLRQDIQNIEANTFKHIEKNKVKYFGEDTTIYQEVKLNSVFNNIDLISNHVPIYDGYTKCIKGEYFIEIKYFPTRFYSFSLFDKLYIMLNKIMVYSKYKNIDTKLLLFIRYDGKEINKSEFQKIQEYFQPAIENKYLEVILMDINENN